MHKLIKNHLSSLSLYLVEAIRTGSRWQFALKIIDTTYKRENTKLFTVSIFEQAENSLTFLLTHYYKSFPIEKVIVLSRLINGALVSYGDHAAFLSTSPVSESLSKSFINENTRDFILNAIANYTHEYQTT